jgi:ferredoxin
MSTILKRDKTISDCFSCGSCLEACPTAAIKFKSGKRSMPPAAKFSK